MRPILIPLSLLLALALIGAGGQPVARAAQAFRTPEPLETPLPTLIGDAAGTAADEDGLPGIVEQAVRYAPSTPTPYTLSTPEPLITPVPRRVAARPTARPRPTPRPIPMGLLRTPEPLLAPLRPVARPQTTIRPDGATRISLPNPGGGSARGTVLTGGTVVYNLVFPMIGTPLPGQDFSVKLTNEPHSNQVEVSMSGKPLPAGQPTPPSASPAAATSVISMAHNGTQPDRSPPLAGATSIQLQIAAPNAREVEFTLDGALIGRDRDGKDGFTLALDTARYPNGRHQLRAIARDDRGAVVQTIEHTVLIQN